MPRQENETWEIAIERSRTRFANHGRFSLLRDERIDEVVRREKVPNARGVYVVFRSDDAQKPLYIGKAGTVNQDGTWKEQGLAKRLIMKQDGTYRRNYFRQMMNEESIAGLAFHWFVTYDQNTKVIPALAEMELLQSHFEQYGCLPKLNPCA